jgi:hypothetical protein
MRPIAARRDNVISVTTDIQSEVTTFVNAVVIEAGAEVAPPHADFNLRG